MSQNKKIFVYWICDKKNCRRENCREIEANRIIIEDKCSFCDKYIMEPIVFKINTPKTRKNPRKLKDDNKPTE